MSEVTASRSEVSADEVPTNPGRRAFLNLGIGLAALAAVGCDSGTNIDQQVDVQPAQERLAPLTAIRDRISNLYDGYGRTQGEGYVGC